MKKLLITAILLASWSQQSSANGASNEFLLEQCKSKESSFIMFCSGLITGFYHSFDMVQTYVVTSGGMEGETGFPFICRPDEVTADQTMLIVIRSIETNPKDLHRHLSTGIFRAFFDAYNCTEKEFIASKNIEVPEK